MNGAEAILRALADAGLDTCFANPGTSEMQMVAAFDREPRVRPVLCLFEGVATGAADGYARIAEKPAATLLHLGPGLANGGANLHNARRAFTPMVNIVGDHATYHQRLDAPLQSDIQSLARPHSLWVKEAASAEEAPALALEAMAASFGPPGGVATLILPADCAWSEVKAQVPTVPIIRPAARLASAATIDAAAVAIRAAKNPVLLMGSTACNERSLVAAARLAANGIRIVLDTFISRLPRGAGRFAPDVLPYFAEQALEKLRDVDLLVLAGTRAPVAFFAYPGKPGILVPEGCRVETLCLPEEDGAASIEALADVLNANSSAHVAVYAAPPAPAGALTPVSAGDSMARWMPERSIVCDDAVTARGPLFERTRTARPHDWLMLTGGAIGSGMPHAIGAAIAAPGSKVISLNGDGAAAYTLQSLWTMARENLDVTNVVFANHAYRILSIELERTRAGEAGAAASKLVDLGSPQMDWTALATGFGVRATRCTTAAEFDAALARALEAGGPQLIEAVWRP